MDSVSHATLRLGVAALLAMVMWLRAAMADPVTEDKSFVATFDQSTQQYVVVWPDGYDAAQPHDVLIALHGHGSDRWQFVKDSRDECRAARDFAARHNMIFLSPDYRAKTSWMGPAAEADVVEIISDFGKQHPVRRVYLCGGSMGGTAALIFAARHPHLLAGVMAMNPTANMLEYGGFQDAIRASYGVSKTDNPEFYRARSPELLADALTMPVGITAGGKDDVVPSPSAVRLVEKLKAQGRPANLVFRAEGGHSTKYDDATSILEWVMTQTVSASPAVTKP